MSAVTKLMTAGGGGVQITPDASIASDVTVKLPTAGINNGTLVCSDSSGNVGIGTSLTGTKGRLRVAKSGGGDVASFSDDATGTIVLSVDPTVGAAGVGFTNDGNGYMKFGTNNTERMRIDSSGNLLVGVTSFSNGVNGKSISADVYGSSRNVTTAANHCEFRNPNGQVGYISTNGWTTTYSTNSDYRLKENIQPMQGALDVVAQLNPVTYTWKADGSDGQGFIAHELQAVVPDCVTGEKDAVDAEGNPVYQGIDTSFLVATLTKAIQEQQEQINELKAEVAALKGAA